MRRGVIVVLVLSLAGLLAIDAWLIATARRYRAEVTRLRASMTALERERTDAIVAADAHTLRTAVELIRRQARLEPELHLAVSLDSGAMYLEREGALLRAMPVEIGPERRIGAAPDTIRLAAPRGVRTVAAILGDSSRWPVPDWVYLDRGLPVPAERGVTGALGAVALVLDGGTIVYTLPAEGPLADSGYVLPGAIRARADDLRAVRPNLREGMRVYLH